MTERTPEETERLFSEGAERRAFELAMIDTWRADLPHWTPVAAPALLCADGASSAEANRALNAQRAKIKAARQRPPGQS